MELSIALMGPCQIRLDGQEVFGFQSNKVRGLLAYLAAERDRPNSREALAGLLWPDYSNSSALTYLRNALSNLRQVIGDSQAQPPFLLVTRESIQINPASKLRVDLWAFDECVKRPGDATSLIRDIPNAISLYRGPFLEGLICDSPDFEDWALGWRERLGREQREALVKLAEAHAELGQDNPSVQLARRALELEPWEEKAHRLVMQGLARSGQRGAALAQYETCRQVLKAELGTEPDPLTTALAEHIRDGKIRPKETIDQAALLSPITSHLPEPLTSFIGRERELDEIAHLLGYPFEARPPERKARLLTLTGAGGCGKTRLAIALAHRLSETNHYTHGVRWVDLSIVSDPLRVPAATVDALGLVEMGGTPAIKQLEYYLRERQTLLVIDNCEHVVEAIAMMVERLLNACPGLKILATSREPLGVPGEMLWRVPNLDTPATQVDKKLTPDELRQYKAVQLFEERAKAASPDWTLEENPEGVLAICNRLDGMPLAIELAAARVRMMSIAQILERLRDVFRFLTGGGRTTFQRHQTLRACIDWSYSLLSAEERELLLYLSVFSSEWSLEAAETIGEELLNQQYSQMEALDVLGRLVDRSLVAIRQDKNHSTRYFMLETIRQYAHEKLVEAGEEESALRMHLDYFFELAVQAEPELRGPDQVRWIDLIETNLNNFRAAMEWAVKTDSIRAMRIASSLLWFWHGRNLVFEGWAWLDRCLIADTAENPPGLENEPEHARARARAITAYCWLFNRMTFGGFNGSKDSYLPFSQKEEGKQRLASYINEAFDLYQRMAKPDLEGLSLLYLRLGIDTRDVKESKALLEKSLTLSLEAGNKFIAAECFCRFARAAVAEGEIQLALKFIDQGIGFHREIGDIEGLGYDHYQKGIIAYYHLYDYSLAEGYIKEAFHYFRIVYPEKILRPYTRHLALLAWKQHNIAEALRHIESIFLILQQSGDELLFASTLGLKARILLQDDPQQAKTLLRETVMYWKKNDFVPYGLPTIAEDLVCMYQQEGQAERAASMLGFVWKNQNFEENVVLDFPRMEPVREALQTSLGAQAFNKAWAEGQSMTLEEAAEYVMREMDIPG